jgi:membrane protein
MDWLRGLFSLMAETWAEFNKDEAPVFGASMAYWAMLSLAPVLMLLLAALGWLLQFWPVALDARTEMLRVLTNYLGPQFSLTIEALLDNMQRGPEVATGLGVIFLLFGAAGVFRQLRYSFRKIWGWRPPEAGPLKRTIRFQVLEQLGAIALALCAGAAFILSFLVTAGRQLLQEYVGPALGLTGAYGGLGESLAVILLTLLVFLLLYKFLPPVPVRWRDVWGGALLATFLWEIGKRLLTVYLLLFPGTGVYGAAGLLLVLMIWVYYSCQILFAGAEFCKVRTRAAQARTTEGGPAEK